jgi:hypothetical protein
MFSSYLPDRFPDVRDFKPEEIVVHGVNDPVDFLLIGHDPERVIGSFLSKVRLFK